MRWASIKKQGVYATASIANAFHWMEHPTVVSNILKMLDVHGYLVLVRSYGNLTTGATEMQDKTEPVSIFN